MKQSKAVVRIGTSNIVVPGSRQTFPEAYQQKSRLHYYSSLFNTLEINSSFYKIPMPLTFEKWAVDVPANFQFTVKLFREITHSKSLVYDAGMIDKFLEAANGTGVKKGCILVQFPGKITLDYFKEVEMLLRQLSAAESGWRLAAEFRSPSWYAGETFELLDEYGASIVLHDIQKAKNDKVNKGADFVYIRFHGPKGNYRGSYGDDFLKDKATQINRWLKSGKDVYAYFNNTIGSAFENAMTLKSLLK